MNNSPLETVLERLDGVRKTGGGYVARCPAHDDKQASLSVGAGTTGAVILKCHAGCTTPDIVAQLGLQMTDLFPPKSDAPEGVRPRIKTAYDYTDAEGNLLYQAIRMEPKDFRQRRPVQTGGSSRDGKGGWIWNLTGITRVLYRLPEVVQAVANGTTIFVVEGEKDADNLARLGLVATTNAAGAGKWETGYTTTLAGAASVVILPDNDEPGEKHADTVATALFGKVGIVKIVRLPGLAPKGDVSDYLKAGGTVDELLQLVDDAPDFSECIKSPTYKTYKTHEGAHLRQESGQNGASGQADDFEYVKSGTYKTYKTSDIGADVPDAETEQVPSEPVFDASPVSLSPELATVPALTPDMIPSALRGWCVDIATRGSFPLEYVVIPALVALGSVVGRRLAIAPKRHDSWRVPLNLWGVVVGPPGVFKTPATAEALKPLHRLELDARESHKNALSDYDNDKRIAESQAKASKAKLDAATKSGKLSQVELRLLAEQTVPSEVEKPTLTRYIVNDVTTEKAQELCAENPLGYLYYRDELSGWLKTLNKQGHENDRAFYLEAWNGTGSYTSDRIGRGTVFCESVCLSVLGGIQPGVLSRYLRHAIEGEEADGLMQRFQLMVYPDPPKKFVNVDRYPDTDAKNAAWQLYQSLAELDPATVGSELPEDADDIPYLHFDTEGQEIFDGWRCDLENRLRSGSETPALVPVLAKYRSLMPKLALLFHLAESGYGSDGTGSVTGAVSAASTTLAVRWCAFLEAHARRVYQSAFDAPMESAVALAERLKERLPNPFTFSKVAQKGWAGLSDVDTVKLAVGVLEDRGWVKTVERRPEGSSGGRPSIEVWINPAITTQEAPAPEPAATGSEEWEATL